MSKLRDSLGHALYLYSSRNYRTVLAQFREIRRFGISAVALQRFLSDVQIPALRREDNLVLENVLRAAAATGVLFYIDYDITGADNGWVEEVESDWTQLDSTYKLSRLFQYATGHGSPVVEIWGLGVAGRIATPSSTDLLLKYFRSEAHSFVVAGVGSDWRTQSRPDSAPSWPEVFSHFDGISPWTIGNYGTPDGARSHILITEAKDIELTTARKQLYIPVVFPGYSYSNAPADDRQRDLVPRLCGKFLSAQLTAINALHQRTLYVAMYDEFNEGTNVAPSLPSDLTLSNGQLSQGTGGAHCDTDTTHYLAILHDYAIDTQLDGSSLPRRLH